ncbi:MULTISPECIES: hypothetical protein [Aeromicrobium]|nr:MULTISPECIES: hypothetical protein [Aeromicrobium]
MTLTAVGVSEVWHRRPPVVMMGLDHLDRDVQALTRQVFDRPE